MPIYHQIAEKLQVRREGLDVPLALPDEHALAAEFSVARTTIRRALRVLEDKGAVTRKQGVGTYLQPSKSSGDDLRGKRIGIVPPWWAEQPGSWYYATILDGVSRWADAHDCAFTVLHAAARPHHEHQWLERIRRQELSGIVWVHPQEDQLKLLFKTAKLFPTVVLGRTIAGDGLHHVIPDYDCAAELIDRHLIGRGHATYGVIGKNVSDPYSQVWMDAFRKTYRKRGAEFHPRPYFLDYGAFNQNRLADLLLDFYLPDHPEIQALVFPTSGSLNLLQSHPRFRERITDDLSIITTNYGQFPVESLFPGVSLTHITCDWSAMAGCALDTLALLAGGHQVPENICQPVELVPGETTHHNQAVAVA
ncbi:MAG: LacI family DNA-binding transcriptional regulator [Chthoniobacterales bacterium]|nr:LacI family DNA-binding transcriptional regulator [Chthoniobacterales bacterium]